ncbi:MAG: flagellar biosynthesis anti-sigma factor FlgM [Nitrospiraceae bacterium]
MEISGQKSARELATLLLGVQESDRAASKKPTPTGPQTDQVQISRRAKEIRRIKSLVQETPATREERVERIRQAIDTGTYDVNGRSTADALIRHVLTEAVL